MQAGRGQAGRVQAWSEGPTISSLNRHALCVCCDAMLANKWRAGKLPQPLMKDTVEIASVYGYKLPVN